MTIQQVTFHKDTFQIHIDKEYYDNELIHEYHYDILGRRIYWYNSGLTIRYYYDINDDKGFVSSHYSLVIGNNYQKLSISKITVPKIFEPNQTIYPIDIESCTHLCTLNNDDAIIYIKNYIKQFILNSHDL